MSHVEEEEEEDIVVGGYQPEEDEVSEKDIEGRAATHSDDTRQQILAELEAFRKKNILPPICFRPPVQDIEEYRSSKRDLIFFVLDVDFMTDLHPLTQRQVFSVNQMQAQMRVFGVTNEGASVLMYIHNFFPYFYVRVPQPLQGVQGADQLSLCMNLHKALEEKMNKVAYKEIQRYNLKRCVTRVELARKETIYGYQPNLNLFFRITLTLPALIRSAERAMEEGVSIGNGYTLRTTEIFESDMLVTLRMMIDKNIRGGGWVKIEKGNYSLVDPTAHSSHCQLEGDTDEKYIQGLGMTAEWDHLPPLRILSYDCEMKGRKNHFPDPKIDSVIQCAMQLANSFQPSKTIASVIHALKGSAPIHGATIVKANTEEELLMNIFCAWIWMDADIISGYNINNFDTPYLLERSQTLGLPLFPHLGRIITLTSDIQTKSFNSSAFKRVSRDVNMEGRVQLDVIVNILREHKLRSYTLNNVSSHFLNSQKEDVHHSIISELQEGTDETRRRLAVYCLKDALLPLQLIEKLMLLVNYVEMARVTGVPINYLLTRGQSIKVVSQVYRKALSHGLLVPSKDRKKSANGEKYDGATVIEPIKGYYTMPIATLDFASLYPSIMMANNLCHSTLMLKQKSYPTIREEDIIKTPTGDQFISNTLKRGLLPEILQELLDARAHAKRLMKSTKDPFQESVLNGRQLALKVSANSIYGITGASTSILYCLPISSSVTGFGRQMIMKTKQTVEEHYCKKNGFEFDTQVVYGDSVTGDTPLYLKQGVMGIPFIERADCVGECEWRPFGIDGKESCETPDVWSWSDKGWTRVYRIIRHRIQKRLFHVSTNHASLFVTEDHSLLRQEDASSVRPVELTPNEMLLHHSCSDIVGYSIWDIQNKTLAYVWAMFIANGHTDGIQNWYVGPLTPEDAFHTHQFFSHYFMKQGLMFFIDSFHNVWLDVHLSDPDQAILFCRDFWFGFYNAKGDKIVSAMLLQSSQKFKRKAWHSYVHYRSRSPLYNGQLGLTSAIGNASIWIWAKSIHIKLYMNIDITPNHPNLFTMEPLHTSHNHCVPIHHTDGYVYDLQTENHHFAAGVGDLIVHNTDSVMVRFGYKDVKTCMKMGKEAADLCTKLFRAPIKLEFEKVYYPYLLMNKKRYAGLYWSNPDKWDKMDAKGIETVRREVAPLVGQTVTKILYFLLEKGSKEMAVKYATDILMDLVRGNIDLRLLVLSKSLSKPPHEYKGNKIAHVELALRMAKRDPGSAPTVGERVSFVVVAGHKQSKVSELAEDPVYVLENNIPINIDYYLEKQLRLPVSRILSPVIGEQGVNRIFSGDLRRVSYSQQHSTGGLLSFVKVKASCQRCRCVLEEDEEELCKRCFPYGTSILLNRMDAVRFLEHDHHACWTQCQKCQNCHHEDILCSNKDCEIFYRRTLAAKKLQREEEKMQRLSHALEKRRSHIMIEIEEDKTTTRKRKADTMDDEKRLL